MAARTQAFKIFDYERLYKHADLLELYLFDTQTGRKPDGIEKQPKTKQCDAVRVQLWRAKSASGGYVVIHSSTPNIWLLDDAIALYNENHSEYTVSIRICLERLNVLRNRMYAESA